MTECFEFQGKIKKINIPQEIGVKYRQFGVFLLQDENGARVDSIACKHTNDAEQINKEILEQWIAGGGKHPVTWQTLTQVLHDIELSTLAGEIEAIKCQPTPGLFDHNHDIPEDENISIKISKSRTFSGQADTTAQPSEQKSIKKTLARSTRTSENDRPDLIKCIVFWGRERRINIPQEIGIKYRDFGVRLLEDDTGARIQSLAHKHMNDAEQINFDVLQQWINGRGKHPVTWKTLTVVLHDIELSALAGEIEAVKCCECAKENSVPSDDPVQKCPEDMPAEDSEQRNHRGVHDLAARDTKDQSSSAPHGVSKNPPIQRSLRDIITEMTNSSEERNIGNIPANDIDDEKYYEAVRQIADIVCRCVQQLQKNQNGHPR